MNINLLDGISLFGASQAIANRYGKHSVTVNYQKLLSALAAVRFKSKVGIGTSPVKNKMLLSCDPDSEGQERFRSAMNGLGIECLESHYSTNYVSTPPGKNANDVFRTDGDGKISRPSSFGARIAYILGLMADYENPKVIVVSHEFELYAPMVDLNFRLTKGNFALAYFGSLVDTRWKTKGLDVTFLDLDPYIDTIFDVGSSQARGDDPYGLDNLKDF